MTPPPNGSNRSEACRRLGKRLPMQTLLAVDVAFQIMRDRQREAHHRALVALAGGAQPPPSQAPGAVQLWLAQAMRRLAVRLDPSVICEPKSATIAVVR